MAKSSKDSSSMAPAGSHGARAIRAADTGEFRDAAKRYVTSNTVSRDVARDKLRELGIVNRNGKLAKDYR